MNARTGPIGVPPLSATLFVLGVSGTFAIGAILGKLAYNGGANAVSLLTIRTIAAFGWLLLFLSLQRVSLRMPAPYRGRALAMGLLLCVQTFGLYSAIEHMAAPLALLTFNTYPMLTALFEAWTGRDPLTRRKLAALIVAFAGLVLALNTGELHPTAYGIASATLGSIAMTAVLILSVRIFAPSDSRVRTLHMTLTAALVFLIVCVATDAWQTPQTTSGWVGFLGVCISFPLAVTGMFIGIGKIGPSHTSFLFNFEPIAVVIMSGPILGQALSASQLVGAALVIGAIVMLQWPARLSPRP